MSAAQNDSGEMTVLEHLIELRKRLFRCLLVTLGLFFVCYAFSKPLLSMLSQPLEKTFLKLDLEKKTQAETPLQWQCTCTEKKPEPPLTSTPNNQNSQTGTEKLLSCQCPEQPTNKKAKTQPFIFLSLTEVFLSEVKIAFWMAMFFAVPYFLIELWGFMRPAMYKKEKKLVSLLFFSAVFCFIGGALFSYLVVFPMGFYFFLSISEGSIALPSLSLASYLDFALILLFLFGLVFELPVVCLILAFLDLITAKAMLKNLRIAILIIVILSAIITPPDPLSMLLMAIPLIALYLLSYLLVGLLKGFRTQTEINA